MEQLGLNLQSRTSLTVLTSLVLRYNQSWSLLLVATAVYRHLSFDKLASCSTFNNERRAVTFSRSALARKEPPAFAGVKTVCAAVCVQWNALKCTGASTSAHLAVAKHKTLEEANGATKTDNINPNATTRLIHIGLASTRTHKPRPSLRVRLRLVSNAVRAKSHTTANELARSLDVKLNDRNNYLTSDSIAFESNVRRLCLPSTNKCNTQVKSVVVVVSE